MTPIGVVDICMGVLLAIVSAFLLHQYQKKPLPVCSLPTTETTRALHALLAVLYPTTSIWPKHYISIASSTSRRLVIPLSVLLEDLGNGTIELRNAKRDLGRFLTHGCVVVGMWTIQLDVDSWIWWSHSKLVFKLPHSSRFKVFVTTANKPKNQLAEAILALWTRHHTITTLPEIIQLSSQHSTVLSTCNVSQSSAHAHFNAALSLSTHDPQLAMWKQWTGALLQTQLVSHYEIVLQ